MASRQGHRDQQAYCCNVQRSIKRIKLTCSRSLMRRWPAAGMTKLALTNSANQVACGSSRIAAALLRWSPGLRPFGLSHLGEHDVASNESIPADFHAEPGYAPQ